MSSGQAPATGEPLRGFLDDWRVHLSAKNRSLGTIECYLSCGTALCDWLDDHDRGANHTDVNARVLETYLAQMHERVGPATVAKHYRSLQQLFKWLVVDGELERS